MIRIATSILPAVLTLAACQDVDPPTAQSTGASGEVLGGSIKDDMIPVDILTSEAPTKKISPPAPGEEGNPENAAASPQPAAVSAEATSPTGEVEQPAEEGPPGDDLQPATE